MSLSVSLTHRRGDFVLDAAFEGQGGVTALFGRSGAGKTTVVDAVAGLIRPDRAYIRVGDTVLTDTDAGRLLPPHRRRVGYVFQEARLFPHLTVRGNLLYGARFAAPGAARPLAEVVEMLGIGPLLDRRIGGLSGGEAQRVAIGRALLAAPRLLLLDEPLAALDAARKSEILPYLDRLRAAAAIPILYVSHDVSEIARIATDIVVLDAGRVIRAGPVADVLSDPAIVAATGVRGAGAMVTGRVTAQHDDGLTELAAAGGALFLPRVAAPIGAALRVRIAAQDVMIARRAPTDISALNILPARVLSVTEGAGPGALVQVQAGDATILARITQRSARALALAPGDAVHAVVKSVSVASGDIAPVPG